MSLQYWLSSARFFAWISLGDVALLFSLTLVRKVNVVDETRWAAWLCHKRNWSICLPNGVTVTSLSALPPTQDEWPRIMRVTSRLTKDYRVSSVPNHAKAKSRNKELPEERPAYIFWILLIQWWITFWLIYCHMINIKKKILHSVHIIVTRF